jgi:hypothetical protein
MPEPSGHKGKLMSFVSKTYASVGVLALAFLTTASAATAQISVLRSPKDVHGFYTTLYGNQLGNGTGNFTFIVWKGDSSGVDIDTTFAGFRVRRTIHGVSQQPFEVVGQWTTRFSQAPLCWGALSPCPGYFFLFSGDGLYFKGFQQNRRADGTYVIDYPPGSPQDTCSNCWVFADGASLSGFRHDYAVTTIDTTVIVNSDYYETPIDSSQIVSILPGSPPRSNLEEIAVVPNPYRVRADWEPGDGTRILRFIRVPDKATVRIFTASGDLLRTLKANQYQNPGGVTGDVSWDLKNEKGRVVVSGIYLYQVETEDGRTRKGKFVIIK